MTQLDDQQLDEIRSALKRSKIEAIKVYKNLTGDSLAASKAFVESLSSDGELTESEPIGNNLSQQQMDQILDELSNGNKLGAIKLYRSASGSTLMESRDFIEKLAADLQIELPEAKGCGAAVLLFAITGSAIAFGVLA